MISDQILISTADEGGQLLADLYYQGFELIIIQAEQLTPAFFDLKSKLAGDVFQKFSNWKTRLSIVGDFDEITNTSLRDFILKATKAA